MGLVYYQNPSEYFQVVLDKDNIMPQGQPSVVQSPDNVNVCSHGKAYYLHCLAVKGDTKMQTGFTQFYYYLKLSIFNKLYYCLYSLPTPRDRQFPLILGIPVGASLHDIC